ncbi:MAG: hypothetical protein Q8R10_02450 [Pseudomonas sp.]|nr:hypothetical protein [Pseudomonas sp.]MDP3845267.1 hypothetical protein [Pseudomonas sp.]
MIELESGLQIAHEGSAPSLVEAYERHELSHPGKSAQHNSKGRKHD